MVVSATSQKKDKLKLPLENRPGQGRKKLTTFKEDRYLLNLMKKDRRKSSRQLASDWNSSHENQLVHERCVDAYLMLVIKVIRPNGNRTENLAIALLD
ncbi:unnamed protein product [Rotaria magnacalcarata]|uniref:Uncharacterized protein n=1 Tax=Rotaria magnacalcarata TaxID=392030 RepID=A0A816YXW0_9BILA|nr:unnamed protein product [Rotaria magnacalcarata]